MHALLAIGLLLLSLPAGHLAQRLLGRTREWSRRRELQLLVLAFPLGGLAAAAWGLYHLVHDVCFLGVPPWDALAGTALPLLVGLAGLCALGLGGARLALMNRHVAGQGRPADARLQRLADRLAGEMGAPRARVLVCAYDRPLALTLGLFRPAIMLSTWMLDHLDGAEMESVLAHELAHAARRDYLVAWLATVLRDAFFYLPSSRLAHRQLQDEKEMACDDLAAGVTRRPLALASALVKAWQPSLGFGALKPAQALVAGDAIEARVQRLLAGPPPVASGPRHALASSVGGWAVAGLVMELLIVASALAPAGCGPVTGLGRFLA